MFVTSCGKTKSGLGCMSGRSHHVELFAVGREWSECFGCYRSRHSYRSELVVVEGCCCAMVHARSCAVGELLL